MTPQVAIGALGRLQTLPRYDDEMNVVPARLISTSWSAATPPLGMCNNMCDKTERNSLTTGGCFFVFRSADHRIIDGATMAQFAIDWKALIERPELMLAQLR